MNEDGSVVVTEADETGAINSVESARRLFIFLSLSWRRSRIGSFSSLSELPLLSAPFQISTLLRGSARYGRFWA